MDPLSKRLKGIHPKVEVKLDDCNFASNHLLFIHELKLMAKDEHVLENDFQNSSIPKDRGAANKPG